MRWQGLGLSLFMGALFMGALAGTAAADTHFPPRGTIEVSVYPCLFAKAVLPGSSGDTQGGTGIPGIGLGDPPAGPGLGPPPFGSAADPAPGVISYPDVPPADEAVYRDRIERAITFWNMNGRSDARLFEMDLRWTDWAPIPITWDAAANPPFPNDRSIEANACLQAHTEAGDLKRGGIKLLLFHPWHDTYGAGNGIAVFGTTNNGAETLGPGAAGINLQTGTVAHEIGHTLLLGHSSAFMANPPANTYPYEYGDAYDVMGRNRVDLSAYHKDRLGLMPYQRVRTLYGSENMVYRLADPTTAANGLHALRIPIDPHDTSRYLLVEYASKYRNVARTDIEAPRLYIYEIGHPDQVISDWSNDPVPRSNMRSMLLFQTRTGLRSFVTPIQSYNHDGVRIDLVMIDGDQAVIRVRSSYAQRCVAGYVWRDARARHRPDLRHPGPARRSGRGRRPGRGAHQRRRQLQGRLLSAQPARR
ncbi:zinc metalloprotease [Phaeovulum vinaykumarii]|uniref:Astacin (Peptidase family M12A) n=1 Tax=Phaeovulum vinaykumarii TaxID=407234 RepID=A0A1N7L7I1_9RHOB|nr:hypothetical protein [Phaeovulum vinaykumarii]SIS69822.1 hypothetical protein SAMN05421795_102656 [Phaeovulum vinaykumarii]SOB99290.1 hypothetical protein SAMN05878426_102116 [Phaeovulum vinaykumarii]